MPTCVVDTSTPLPQAREAQRAKVLAQACQSVVSDMIKSAAEAPLRAIALEAIRADRKERYLQRVLR